MRTPSLAHRVTVAGVAVLGLLVVVLDIAIYFGVRSELEGNLGEVLETRLDIARGLASDVTPDELAPRLTALGVPASVQAPDGRVLDADPAVPRFGAGGIPDTLPLPRVQASDEMAGMTITVYATRSGVDAALRRLLVVEVLGTAAALGVAVVLVRRSTAVALAPLREVVGAAVRTAAGARGQRLRPDNPGTELGRLAAAFDEMLDELEAAVEAARASDARSRRFLADAAHQLRTPVAGIRASVESLVREDDEAVRDRLVGNLVRETGRSARLLADLLLVARLDSGTGASVRVPTDLAELAATEVLRARDLAPHLEIGLTTAGGPATADVDPAEIREALGNLLDNARRHARARIDVTVAGREASVTIEVRDDGPGVPAALAAKVFDRFASLDGMGGSGLGLPIARAVARAHGGDLELRAGAFMFGVARSPTAVLGRSTSRRPEGPQERAQAGDVALRQDARDSQRRGRGSAEAAGQEQDDDGPGHGAGQLGQAREANLPEA